MTNFAALTWHSIIFLCGTFLFLNYLIVNLRSQGFLFFILAGAFIESSFNQKHLVLLNVSGESVIDRYTFFLSDECLIAPNSIFYPDLFELTSSNEKKRTRFVLLTIEFLFDCRRRFIRQNDQTYLKRLWLLANIDCFHPKLTIENINHINFLNVSSLKCRQVLLQPISNGHSL